MARVFALPERSLARTALSFAALALLIVVVAFIISQIYAVRGDVGRLTVVQERSNAVSRQAAAVTQGMVDSETGMRGYVITHRPDYLQPYEAGKTNAARAIEALRGLVAKDLALKPDFERIEANSAEAGALIDQSVALMQKGKAQQAFALVVTDRGKAAMDELRAATASMTDAAAQQALDADRKVAAARARGGQLLMALSILFGALAGLGGFILWSERRELARKTQELSAAIATVSEARAHAEAADAAKTRFLAIASHDMRQPLHAISLYLAALTRRVEGAQAKEILNNMETAAQSLTRMFSGLLDLARIESGVLQAKFVSTPLHDILEGVAVELRDDAKRTKSDLRVVKTSQHVFTDPELLGSVVRNLVTNALKYAGGGRIIVGCRHVGQFVRIEVHDEGPGIARDKITFIFGEFVRLDSAKGGGVDGLGLGLSIALRLASLLGQKLEVKSEFGKGTCFSLLVPVAVAAGTKVNSSPKEQRADLTGINVAVMDDDVLALAATAAVLTDAGAQVHAMPSAQLYIAALNEGAKHDVIVLNPVLLAEAGQLVRDRKDYVTPPLVVVTGATDAATLARLEASKLPWLIKPAKEDVLLRMVANAARQRRPMSAPSTASAASA